MYNNPYLDIFDRYISKYPWLYLLSHPQAVAGSPDGDAGVAGQPQLPGVQGVGVGGGGRRLPQLPANTV